MLIHGVSPSELLIGTMVPLQKDNRKAHHSSDNYRALTLGNVILVNFMMPLLSNNKLEFLTRQIYNLGLKMAYLQQYILLW